MDLFSITLLILMIFGFAAMFWILKNQNKEHQTDDRGFMLLQNQMNEVVRTLDLKLGESTRSMQRQSTESARIIRDVTERLTKLDETNKQVVSFADQLQN